MPGFSRATLIGLPSGPSRIFVATMARFPASAGGGASVAYCKLLGEIAPVDPAAPPIRFEVILPEQWNGKAVQYGGGGFNGRASLPGSIRWVTRGSTRRCR